MHASYWLANIHPQVFLIMEDEQGSTQIAINSGASLKELFEAYTVLVRDKNNRSLASVIENLIKERMEKIEGA